MKQNTGLATLSLFFLVIVSGTCGIFLIATSSPATGNDDDGSDVSAQYVGNYNLFNEDFNSQPQNLTPTIPRWTFSGPVVTRGSEYEKPNPDDKKLFLGRSASATFNIDDAITDPNRNRVILEFNYKCSVENDYYTRTYASGSEKVGSIPNTYSSDVSAQQQFTYKRDAKVKLEIPFAVSFKTATTTLATAAFHLGWYGNYESRNWNGVFQRTISPLPPETRYVDYEDQLPMKLNVQQIDTGGYDKLRVSWSLFGAEEGTRQNVLTAEAYSFLANNMAYLIYVKRTIPVEGDQTLQYPGNALGKSVILQPSSTDNVAGPTAYVLASTIPSDYVNRGYYFKDIIMGVDGATAYDPGYPGANEYNVRVIPYIKGRGLSPQLGSWWNPITIDSHPGYTDPTRAGNREVDVIITWEIGSITTMRATYWQTTNEAFAINLPAYRAFLPYTKARFENPLIYPYTSPSVADSAGRTIYTGQLTNYQTHSVMIVYDPVVINGGLIMVDGQNPVSAAFPGGALNAKATSIVFETRKNWEGTDASWDTPNPAYNAGITIDNVRIWYPNQPEIVDAETQITTRGATVKPAGDTYNGRQVTNLHATDDALLIRSRAKDLMGFIGRFVETAEATVKPIGSATSITYSLVRNSIQPDGGNGNGIADISGQIQISDLFAQFPGYLNGDIMQIEIKVSNHLTFASDKKTYYVRIFRASMIPFPAFESGMSIDSGNVSVSTIFSISGLSPAVTGYSVATTGANVPKYEPYVYSNRAGVNSTAKVSLITTPSIQYKIDVKFNATKLNWGVPIAAGVYIGMLLHVPVRVQFNAQTSAVDYTTVLKTDHPHWISENEAATTVRITSVGGKDIASVTSVTEDDMKAVDGIDVVVTVNDPTGIVAKAGGAVKIRGIVERSGEVKSNEKSMALISPGVYTATVPTWWIDGPTEVTSVTLTAFMPTLPYQDEKTINIVYTKPDFAVDKPSLSDSEIPAAYRQDDVLSLAIEYAEIFSTISKIKVKLVETSAPAVLLIDTQITNPSAVFEFNAPLNAYVLTSTPSIFPALANGLYAMTITVFDTANFTATRTVSFTVSLYAPSVTEMKMVLPSSRNVAGTVFYGMLPVTVSINANSEMSDLISIKYKIVKITGTTETVIAPYGTTLPDFPANPVFVNSTSFVKTKSVAFSFDSTYFDGSYKMTVLVETYNRATKSSQFNEFAVNIKPIGGIIFSVSQVRPVISWNEGYPGASTYSSGNVDFAGSVTDANKDIVAATLFYDIPGVANNIPLVLNPDGTFAFSIPTASFLSATNTITISARDSKMGVSEFITEPTRTFHVDTSAPSYDATAIENHTGGSLEYYTDGDVLSISATITDTKGLKYVGLTIKDTIFGTVVFQNVFHDGSALPAGTEIFKYDVAPGVAGDLAISDSTMFNVQVGSRRAFSVEWLSVNDYDKESQRIDTLVIDKRTASIYSFIEGNGIVQIDVSPSSIVASVSKPDGLDIIESGFIITSGEFSIKRPLVLSSGITYAATFEMRDLDSSISQYTMEIYAITENGYRSSSKFTIIVAFSSPVITLDMDKFDFDQSNEFVDLISLVNDPNGDLATVEYSVIKIEIGSQSPTEIPASIVNGKYEGRFTFGSAYGGWIVTVTATDLAGSVVSTDFTIHRASSATTTEFFIKTPTKNQIVEDEISIDVEILSGFDLIVKSEYRIAEESSGWVEFATVSSEANFHLLATVPATNFAPGTKTVQVRIEIAGGERKAAEVKVTKIAPIQDDLDAPVLGTPSISGYNVTLSWTAVQGATGYQVYRVNGTQFQLVYASIATSTNKITFSETLLPGQYRYAVAAYDSIGRGPLSNDVPVSIVAAQPSQSFLDTIFQSVQSFFGFIMMLFSSILGIFGIVIIRARNVNKARGLDTSLDCMLNPNQAKCKIRDL